MPVVCCRVRWLAGWLPGCLLAVWLAVATEQVSDPAQVEALMDQTKYDAFKDE